MKTAEEFLRENGCPEEYEDSFSQVSREDLIEFAKMHVEAALKKKITAMYEYSGDGYSLDEMDAFTKNAYPLENIK